MPEPEFYENYNLQDIITPINCEALTKLLVESNYDKTEIQFLHDGFTNGFDIGYEGPQIRQSEANNLPFTIGNHIILWNKLMKEVKLNRVAGPFTSVPFENYIQSPIGLVPKDGGQQTRLIFHLSYNFEDGNKSVNYHTSKDKCTVKYRDLDHAIASCLRARKEGKEKHRSYRLIYMGKSDVKSAFRILPLSVRNFPWLIMKARHPLMNQWCYFVDKCLPFGASISCALFQRFSDALCHIVQFKTKSRTSQTTLMISCLCRT